MPDRSEHLYLQRQLAAERVTVRELDAENLRLRLLLGRLEEHFWQMEKIHLDALADAVAPGTRAFALVKSCRHTLANHRAAKPQLTLTSSKE